MSKVIIFLMASLFLLLNGCADSTNKVSDSKRPTIGNNNGIEFQRIHSGVNKTKYGISEIFFESEEKPFAIISVPANEDVSTHFKAIITPEKRSSNLSLMTFRNSPNFSLNLDGSNENLDISVTKDNQEHIIGIEGKFTPYSQENIVLMSSHSEQTTTRELRDLPEDSKLRNRENTVYVISYPWREIRVRGISRVGEVSQDLIDWANNNVFNQAICKLILVAEGEDYDCRIVLDPNPNAKGVEFRDESRNIYDMYTSKKIDYAIVRDRTTYGESVIIDNASEINKLRIYFSYAVAHMLGVSDDNDSYNLMNENNMGNNANIAHVNLTFRQWNQLHANEMGR